MLNKKNKVSETMICRYIYITLTLIVGLNVIAFPCLSLFPFQWALILGALFINIDTNDNTFGFVHDNTCHQFNALKLTGKIYDIFKRI